MEASELLHYLRDMGLVLTLTSAGGLHVAPREALTDYYRSTIRAQRDALVLALRTEAEPPPQPHPPHHSGLHLMAPEQSDQCHAGGWNDAEINTFTAKKVLLISRGCATDDAEQIAERLTLRDRQHDDRQLCLECAYLQGWSYWRCGNWQTANVAGNGLSRDIVFLFQRCVGFKSAQIAGTNSQMISENLSLQGR
jgi:hypothetical protein